MFSNAIIVIVMLITFSFGFPTQHHLLEEASLNESSSPTQILQTIRNWFHEHQVSTDPNIQKIFEWLKGSEAAEILESMPQIQNLIDCIRRELGIEPWETLSGMTPFIPNGQEVILFRQMRATSTNPISIPQLLSDFLNKTGVDNAMDRIRELIEKNVDVRRISSLLDGPVWNYILDFLTSLPIFTVFNQEMKKLDSGQNFEQMFDKFKQMLINNKQNQNAICQLT